MGQTPWRKADTKKQLKINVSSEKACTIQTHFNFTLFYCSTLFIIGFRQKDEIVNGLMISIFQII